MLASVCHRSWGVHPQTAITFYKTIIRPKADWACYLFANANQRLLNRIQVLQNSAIRLCLGSIRTTPINTLHHLAGIPTLKIRYKFCTKRMLCRMYSSSSGSVIPKLQFLGNALPALPNTSRIGRYGLLFDCWRELHNSLEGYHRSFTPPTYTIPFESLFISDLVDTEWGNNPENVKPLARFHSLVKSLPLGTLILWADGSASPNGRSGAGCAKLGCNTPQRFRLADGISALSCEMAAVLLSIPSESANTPSLVYLFTDSLETVKALQKNGLSSSMSPLEALIREKIWSVKAAGGQFKIVWAPKAWRLPLSVLADSAAGEGGLEETLALNIQHIGDLLPSFKSELEKEMDSFSTGYGGACKGRSYIDLVNPFSLKTWFGNILDMSRREVVTLNRARSGHSRCRAHLVSKGYNLEENCECGGGLHDLNHLVWDCENLRDHRVKFINVCASEGIIPGTDVQELACRVPRSWGAILEFFKEGCLRI